MSKIWEGTPPEKCDLGGCKLNGVFVDGKTKAGLWGIMCPDCHLMAGVGLGTGRGQRYLFKDGVWMKVAG